MDVLRDKKIILGVTGGIAAYKSCEVIRQLDDLGVTVQVIMTDSAKAFVAPLTFETLTRQPVLSDMFGEGPVATRHIDLPREADKLVICPATANTIGKIANGLADDLLSTVAMVAGAEKTLICPAMNTDMWENPAVAANVKRLKASGYAFVDPDVGLLACMTDGIGKLAPVEQIVSALKIELLRTAELQGRKILITAGPTEEPLDPVRFLTNRSSGKMGYALAEAALSRSAEVTLISGPSDCAVPAGINLIQVRTSSEMAAAVEKIGPGMDVIIMSAAVSDYRPVKVSRKKIKKAKESLTLDLQKTTDILAALGQKKQDHQVLVGFAVETDDLVTNAASKLRQKNLDLIVANDPNEAGAGFNTDTNIVTLIDRDENQQRLPKQTKFEVALHILDEVAVCLGLAPPRFKSAIQV